ncbi:hypothetical protein ACIPYS_09360 [Kitasatospora sp. NPDC089913]|uniref:hypothetical protein n=1 Tax=Kitasatospora sp. NPDC089913 TaxID=3364080 RepID=UPI00380F9FAE
MMNNIAAPRFVRAAALPAAVFGALMMAAVSVPNFMKSAFGMSSDSASAAWNAINTGMDVASAVGLASGGLAVGAIAIWGLKRALKSGGKSAAIK